MTPLPSADDMTITMVTEPTTERSSRCLHCGAEIVGRVLASFNGGPLCLGDDETKQGRCYRMVSTLNHQMPCEGDPCPGEVPMEHNHEEGDH